VGAPRICYRLGRLAFEVVSADPIVFDHLDDFYDRATPGGPVAGRLEVRTECSSRPEGLSPNAHGVYVRRAADGILCVWGGSRDDRRITARKVLREAWIAKVIRRRFSVLHGSGVTLGGKLLLILGHGSAGKTTLMLDAMMSRGAQYFANDVVLAECVSDRLCLTSIPTYIKVKPDSRPGVVEFLLTRGSTAPTWDVGAGRWVLVPRQLAGTCAPSIWLEPGRSVVVVASFMPPGSLAQAPATRLLGGTPCALMEHTRWDWVERLVASGHGIASLPDRARFERTAGAVARHLLSGALCVEFTHHGDCATLLELVDGLGTAA